MQKIDFEQQQKVTFIRQKSSNAKCSMFWTPHIESSISPQRLHDPRSLAQAPPFGSYMQSLKGDIQLSRRFPKHTALYTSYALLLAHKKDPHSVKEIRLKPHSYEHPGTVSYFLAMQLMTKRLNALIT